VIESGQYSETGASPYIFYEDQAHAKVNDNTWPSSSDPIEMVTTSVYTTPSGITYYNNLEQEYLLNRISSSTYDTDGDNTTTYDRVTYNYSYDPHGNVSWVVMEHPQIGNQYLRYEYDLLSGNVKKVCYNEYESDRFFHKYNYDADGRILYAQTSINNYVWEKDATYNYYDHGPLKRTVIGEDKVQGMDYIYTIQGWLKAINDPLLNITADPSQDGSTTTSVAKDAFAMALSYYTNDFTNNQILTGAGDLSPQYPLYNGNIAAWTTNHQAELGTSSNKFIQLTAYQYKYDKLNRIRNADFKIYTSAWGDPTIGTGSQFDALFVYDRNGNIDALKRNAHSEGPNQTEINPLMDDFSYHYESQTNKLINLDDAVTTSNFQDVDIIDFNPTTGDNYQYDRIGNLIVDQSENIDNIEWNAQGKIEVIEKQIDDGGTMIDQEIHFYYDPLGNRIRKEVRYPSNQINNTTTFYVRDLQGNIMCTYTREDSEASPTGYVATYSVDEYPIYGSDRLGVYRADESNILFQIEYPDFNHLPEYQNTSNNTTPTYNIGRLALSSIKYNNFTSPTSYRQAQIPSSAIEHISNTSSTQQSLNNSIIHCNNLAICSDYDGNVLAMASNVSNMNGSKNANALIITDAQGIPYASTANIKSDPNSQNLFVKTPGMDTYYLFTIGSDTKAYYHIIDPINKIVLQKNICIDSLSGYSYSIAAIMDEAGNGKSKLFLKRFSNDTTHLYTFNFNHNGITFKQHIDAIPSNDADLSAPLTLSANAQSLALVVNKSKPRFLFRSAKSTELRIYDISTNHDTVSFNDSIQFSNYYISSLAFSQKNHYLYFQKNDMQGNADLYRYSISAQSSEAITSVSAQGKMMYSDSLIYIMDNDNIEALAYTDTSSIANLQRSSITPPNTYRYSGFSASTTINILNAALYDPTSATNFDRVTDYKLYELKDHLGNVRVVISDIKEPTDANFNQFTADLQSYYNYYPFGMLQPKRHYTLAEEYKFGFNGMEMDNEVEGNTGSMYSTTFRELDVRLGRWWGTDPIEHPFQSPYCTFDNNPVIIYDPSGADGGGDKETGEVTATVYFQWDPEEDHTGDNLDNYIHNFANNVRQNWNNYTLDNGQQVSVDNVQFLPAPDGMTEDDLDKNENLLTVGNGASASDNSIPGVSYINKNFRRNTGYMYFSMNGSDASHEFGHMLGLSDRYFEGFAIDKNGGLYSQRITMPNKFKQNGYDCQTNLMSNPNPVLTTLNSKQLNIAFNRNRKEWKHQRVALIHSGARSYNSASFFLGKVRYFNGDNRVSGSGWWYHQLYKKRFKKSTPQKANRVTVNTNNLWP
jgi:RHS repeat-associated protein